MVKVLDIRKGSKGNYAGGSSNSGDPPHNEDMEHRVNKLEETVAGLPTKADLAELRAGFAELRADVKTGISGLQAEMHKNSIDVYRWMLGTVVGLFLGFGGLFLAMSNGLKQSAAPTPQASPVFITVPTPPAPAAALPVTPPASR